MHETFPLESITCESPLLVEIVTADKSMTIVVMVLCLAMNLALTSAQSGKDLQNPQRGFESHRRITNSQTALEDRGFLFFIATLTGRRLR
jgi:hypothetical protein